MCFVFGVCISEDPLNHGMRGHWWLVRKSEEVRLCKAEWFFMNDVNNSAICAVFANSMNFMSLFCAVFANPYF